MHSDDHKHSIRGESEELGQTLLEHTRNKSSLYDEVGDYNSFGWHALIIVNNMYFIVTCVRGIFKYEYYESRKAASKAWDHVCNRFERWFINHG